MLKEKEIKILENLNKYRYLTTSHFLLLKLEKYKRNIYPHLKHLLSLKLIDKNVFGVCPKNGKLEDFYFLTSKGANFLIDNFYYEPQEIARPKNINSLFFRDYHHRKSTIYFNIFLNQWLEQQGGEIEFFYNYFDKTGSNRTQNRLKAKTKIPLGGNKSFIPDGVFKYTIGNKTTLAFLEIHNGKDTARAIRQIKTYLKAFEGDIVQKLFNYDRATRVYYVLENRAYLSHLIKALKNDDDLFYFYDFFRFKTFASLEADFFNNWETIGGDFEKFL